MCIPTKLPVLRPVVEIMFDKFRLPLVVPYYHIDANVIQGVRLGYPSRPVTLLPPGNIFQEPVRTTWFMNRIPINRIIHVAVPNISHKLRFLSTSTVDNTIEDSVFGQMLARILQERPEPLLSVNTTITRDKRSASISFARGMVRDIMTDNRG